MQREAGGVRGTALTNQATALLEWSLQQVGILHEPSIGAVCAIFFIRTADATVRSYKRPI